MRNGFWCIFFSRAALHRGLEVNNPMNNSGGLPLGRERLRLKGRLTYFAEVAAHR